ncbi:MAG: biosynthetic-type acetolactate synthase large subunit [Rikenellaceae bacterium]
MANKQKVQGSDALLLSLIAEQTDIIFGYPGGQVIPIYDRLYDYSDRIRHILTRHEQGAVHAAQGYARVTGKVGVCMATSGPGATNLVTGIADAMLDSTPLVCITGQVPAALLGTDAFQEADMISMTMPVTKWNYQVTSASEIAPAIARAFYIARSGRPGPVVIDIAKNAQVEECEFAYRPCLSLRSYTPNPVVDKDAVSKAVEMINASERPLVLVGQGVKLSGAEQELLEFAEIGNLPVGQTLMGISTVPNNHPLFVGNLGMHGNIPANSMTQKADLIIALGLRFSDRITGNVAKYAPEAKIIHVDIDKAELGKNVRVDLPIHANLKDAIEMLKAGLKYEQRQPWFDFADEKKQQELDEVIVPGRADDKPYITMARVMQDLATEVKGEAIVVTDVGQNQMFSALYSKFNNSRSFVTSGGLGTMGFGLPAAMGAKLGAENKQVVAVMGDGGFQMSMQELGTIMQNKIGVKMLILNNSFLGMVRQWQQLFFDRRYSFTTLENPDFSKVAAAYNIPTKRVVEKKDLEGAIKEMLAAEGSYLLEVCVENEENVFPMVPAGASLSESIYKA